MGGLGWTLEFWVGVTLINIRLGKNERGWKGQEWTELQMLEGKRKHGVREPIETLKDQHVIGDKCENEG